MLSELLFKKDDLEETWKTLNTSNCFVLKKIFTFPLMKLRFCKICSLNSQNNKNSSFAFSITSMDSNVV